MPDMGWTTFMRTQEEGEFCPDCGNHFEERGNCRNVIHSPDEGEPQFNWFEDCAAAASRDEALYNET